jgi:orotidine-5'-phosphate decarboxylase
VQSTSSPKAFVERLLSRQRITSSCLCVGLDPDLDLVPDNVARGADVETRLVAFNAAVIEATADVACAFKLNLAFYERYGAAGWNALRRTVDAIPAGCIKIADAKRGDIGNTARFYAEAFFHSMSFDACTLSPYMGVDSISPFAAYADKAVFVLCRTSNPSADDFQLSGSDRPLFADVARRANDWDAELSASIGLVVGATRLGDLEKVRRLSPALPFLIPGVGAQGGDPIETVRVSRTSDGPVLVNSSRSILYASRAPDFADAARHEARRLAAALEQTPIG